MVVDTPGGRIYVKWDHGASATPNAQLTFFSEFLATTGVYSSWVDSCPLSYTSPNAPSKQDVLGTWLLAILAGHNRYAHITGLRGDIKPIFGKQSGAEVSDNPHKPGRPSHALHTYWVGNLRLVLDVVVCPGKEHSAAKARPGLIGVLEKLTPQQRPALVRGDCGFGNEPFIAELEERAQPYLFKLRQSVRFCMKPCIPPHRVTRYIPNPNHSCKAVCHSSKLRANEYSVHSVASPVLKSTGYAVTLHPTASNSGTDRGMCQAEVTSSQGCLQRSPNNAATCKAFSRVVREPASSFTRRMSTPCSS